MTWNINFQMYFLLGYLASWRQGICGLDAFADPSLSSKQDSRKFQLNQVNKLNQETILFRKTLVLLRNKIVK